VLRIRFGASVILAFAIAAAVGGQDPKKDPPKDPPKQEKKETPKEQPKAEPPKTEQPPPMDPNARSFALKLEKGKSWYQETTTQVTQVIKVQGQDLTQNQNSTFWFKWTPTKEEGGKWTLEQEVEGLKMTIDISGNVITYDSTKLDGGASAGNPGLMEFFKKLVGTKFTVTLDKGKVEKVEGKEEFIKSLGAGSPQMDTLLKSILTEDALKEMCDPTFKLTPDSPKKVGESWKRESTTNLGPIGSYTVTYNFKYAGVEKDMDKIDVDTSITYVAPKSVPEGLLFKIKEGKMTTEPTMAKNFILFNPKEGRIESADITIKLKGELTVTIGGTDTKVELTQEQKTTIKTSDKTLKPAPEAKKTP